MNTTASPDPIEPFSDVRDEVTGWNVTSHDDDPIRRAVFMSIDILSIILAYGSILAMACDIRWKQIKEVFVHPVYLAVGLACQYVLMPLLGLGAISVFSFKGYMATGVMVLSCCPGGGYSNLLTYLLNGEVSLSVVLTTISSALAFGIMPLNLWLYKSAGVTSELTIPFWNMLITLLLLDLMLVLGLLCRWKWPAMAKLITKVGSVLLSFAHLIWLSLWLVLDPWILWRLSWRLYSAVVMLSSIGILVPMAISWLLGFTFSVGKTLAIETSYQSIGTALTICIVSFPREICILRTERTSTGDPSFMNTGCSARKYLPTVFGCTPMDTLQSIRCQR